MLTIIKIVTVLAVSCMPRTAWAFSLYSLSSQRSPHLSKHTALRAISFPKRGKTEEDRFDRTAPTTAEINLPCRLMIHGKTYDLAAWAKAHPGGVKVLQKFHNKDATRAFDAAGHSSMAYEMLKDFEVTNDTSDEFILKNFEETGPKTIVGNKKPRWRAKLFTSEDSIGIHKYAGAFVLLHYLFRYSQMYFGDPSAGFGSRGGKGVSIIAPLCLLPHVLLSLSSLIFHTVPRERVVGKPMIWQEYRIHNICFALRSVLVTFLGWLSIAKHHAPGWRRFCVTTGALSILGTNAIADIATKKLRAQAMESTTATMPYWEGCSVKTQKRFKHFYAYCQFMATIACMSMWNPAWGLAVMLPIQLASLLMTLVRKGIISAKGYHMAYTISLCMPFFVGLRTVGLQFVPYLGLGWALYQLRRQGVDKYTLWAPLVVLRIAVGDKFIAYQGW